MNQIKNYRPVKKAPDMGKAFASSITIPSNRRTPWYIWWWRSIRYMREYQVRLLYWVLALAVATVIIMILVGIAGNLKAATITLQEIRDARQQQPSADMQYIQLCSLDTVVCPGEVQPQTEQPAVTVTGTASWLKYTLPDTCAARDWPKGSTLAVSTPKARVVCVVRDYGPNKAVHPDRIIDLSLDQFRIIANPASGLTTVTIEQL